MKTTGCSTNANMLLGYLEGALSASDAAVVEERLANSAIERRKLDELQSVREMLMGARTVPGGVDLVEGVHRRARERQRDREMVRARFGRWPGILASAAAIALGVGSLWSHTGWFGGADGAHPPPAAGQALHFAEDDAESLREVLSEFRAKSSPNEATREWVDVQIYQVGGDGEPRRVRDQIERGTGLLFSYVNVSSADLGYLMIFSVDARGQVVWFHPARGSGDGDATSLRIERSGKQVAIPELIDPALSAGELRIYAAFTRSALHVGDVERWLSNHPGGNLALPPDAGRLVVTPVRVAP